VEDVLTCLKKYVEATQREKFVIHWKMLSHRFLLGIKEGYRQKNYEPKIVDF
jgi:very-short-patch-repair endonuclease